MSLGVCEAIEIESPDGDIRMNARLVESEGRSQIVYDVKYHGRQVLAPSKIAFVQNDGVVIGHHLVLRSAEEPKGHYNVWEPVYGERSKVEDSYNQAALNLYDASADCTFNIVLRCYNQGVAFKVVLENSATQSPVTIKEERSEFNFLGDHIAWCAYSAQGECHALPISRMGEQVERPLVVRVESDVYAAITEAKLVDYARMKLQRRDRDPHGVVSQLSSHVHSTSALETPWRVLMLGRSPGSLLENNDILLNLNDPCAIADTSWIKPGKVIRDITLTTEGGKACIDFAAENNLQYVEFDAGWYGHEYDDASDPTTVTLDPKRSDGPFDLHELIAYADERGIGVIVYVNRRALEPRLDEILPLYKSWGISGVKYGFVNVGSQRWTSWLHEAIRKAAEHQLMVDVHDEYRPTGYSRTYPNLMTQEGVRGDEASPSSEQAVTTLFTRYVAGAADHTVCYFADRVDEHWSHAHQLAKVVCCYSPWQFLFWYDSPLPGGRNGNGANTIRKTPEQEFFRRVPTTWDETRVLEGEIGEFAVIARRSGDQWYVGAMNGPAVKSLEIPLTFLSDGRQYQASIYRDATSADDTTGVAIERRLVDSQGSLPIAMPANGGQAIHFTPVIRSAKAVP